LPLAAADELPTWLRRLLRCALHNQRNPRMPEGKAAGMRCAQLTEDLRCAVFGRPERPACCSGLRPSPQMCGRSRADALRRLGRLEAATRP